MPRSRLRSAAARVARRRHRRLPLRLDLTPVVDVALVLLVVFALVEVFTRPTAMEINLPLLVDPTDCECIALAESNVLFVRVDAAGAVWTASGREAPVRLAEDRVEGVLRYHAVKNDNTVVVFKPAREAAFERVIDVLDWIDRADVKRFAIGSSSPLGDPFGGCC